MKPIILLICLAALLATVAAVVIEVPGYATELEGTDELSANTERPFYAFRGVPYAEAPTSLTRFLPPVPKAPFPDGVTVDATRNNIGCTQGGDAGVIGQEDCLTLNVFTPKLRGDGGQLLPVLFWIHGGGFSLGQAIEYIPTRFMEEDVVVVVIQYRLGPLGFLCFDTDDVPGNAGIFDQIEALRWVNRHIQAFGGDPTQVTIAGESAGSASVSLLLLAPQARGLFVGAIGESGSTLAEWALDSGDRGKTASTRVAELAGCPINDYPAMLDCVRNIGDDALTRAYSDYSSNEMLNGGLGFSASNPVIQKAGQERIIEAPPRDLIASGNYAKVPTMWGANKQEGTLVLGTLYNNYLVPNDLVNNTEYMANKAVPDILKALNIPDEDGSLAAELTETYLEGADMGDFNSMSPGLIDLLSVLFIKAPTYEMAQLVSASDPVYFYAFNFLGRNSLFDYVFIRSPPPFPHGVCHADELIYLWVYPFPSIPPGLNRTEQALSDQMVKVWTNFVIHGEPTPAGLSLPDGVPEFLPYTRTQENYMAIDSDWQVKQDFTQTYTVTVDELNQSPKYRPHPRSIAHSRTNRRSV